MTDETINKIYQKGIQLHIFPDYEKGSIKISCTKNEKKGKTELTIPKTQLDESLKRKLSSDFNLINSKKVEDLIEQLEEYENKKK